MAISTGSVSVPQLGGAGGINSDIYGNKEAPKGMTLLELQNLSRGNIALQKERELLQPSIEKGKSEAELAKTTASKAKLGLDSDFAGKMRQNQVALLNNPIFVRAEQDPVYAQAHLAEMHDLISKQKESAIEMGLDPAKAEQLNAPYHVALDSSKGQGGRQFMKTRLIAGLDTQAQAALQPGQYYEAAPTAQQEPSGVSGGQAQTGGTQPQQTQPTQPQPTYSQPEKLQYQPLVAGQPRAQLPSEAKDTTEGQNYRSGLINRQSTLVTDKRNVDEVIKTANELEKSWVPTSGLLGSAYRHVATWAGDPTYKQLSKDLANVQMANIKAQGGSLDTVAGQQLSKMANGDETYPPSVLMNIAARAKADMTNIDAQAKAAQKFSDRFGDNNMKSFQQMWSKNADSKIFEVMSIAEDKNLSAQEKKKIVDNLLGDDPKQRQEFNQKYQNILKLQQTGTL